MNRSEHPIIVKIEYQKCIHSFNGVSTYEHIGIDKYGNRWKFNNSVTYRGEYGFTSPDYNFIRLNNEITNS